jgi:hypothetical protein
MGKYVSAFVLICVLWPVVGIAQTISGPVAGGACVIDVTLPAKADAGTRIELEVNKRAVTSVGVDVGETAARIVLRGPVSTGNELRARRIVNGKRDAQPGPAVKVGNDKSPQCEAPTSEDKVISDERDTFDASLYLGKAVDNFAPASVGGYADPESGGKTLLRFVGGADFEFRLTGAPEDRRQLWIFGETMHGVRTADVNCSPDNKDKPAVCDKLTLGPTGNASQQFQFTLENATSLEAYAGFRYEFMTLQAGNDTPAKLYATARWGVMMLSGATRTAPVTAGSPTLPSAIQTSHAYQAHHLGVGLLLPKGKFDGSLLEIGWGRTDLFSHGNVQGGWNRLKIDGALSVKLAGPMYGFLQMYSDFDPIYHGSDSVQTFFGVSFEVPEIFR